LFDIFERDPAKRVAHARLNKLGSANKKPGVSTPRKAKNKANQKRNLMSPSIKRKLGNNNTFDHVTAGEDYLPNIMNTTTPNSAGGGGGLVKKLRLNYEKVMDN
jgi:hypothetical protein